MLTLGEVLSLSRRSADALDGLALEPDLRSGLARAAADEGVEPRDIVLEAVADFAASADAGEWTALIGRAQAAQDPGRACLEIMIRRLLPAARPADEETSHG
ncbi:hypothetical protein [Phenylobacterium zucineum]|uniref:hypothetical protein n=1 Tax=Phenylobacterium zucineum TaxID=284016 RepID=UPI000317FC7D|nr:hypothetical protein [Phenylobacterium zucineum]